MNEKRLPIPPALLDAWREVKAAIGVRSDVALSELKPGDLRFLFNEANRRRTRDRSDPGSRVELDYGKVLETGDMRDAYLVKFWCLNILEMPKLLFTRKYSLKTSVCMLCEGNAIGNQSHFVDRCKGFEDLRKGFVTGLAKMRIELGEGEVLNFLHELRWDVRLVNLEKSLRISALNLVKDYILALHRGLKSELEKYLSNDGS